MNIFFKSFGHRSTTSTRSQQSFQVAPLFDSSWYMDTYHDVAGSHLAPFDHYIKFGWHEGRRPHPLFDPNWYLAENPDVKEANLEPLTHYSEVGWREGRKPHELFDGPWYLRQNPDVLHSGLEPLAHYVANGWRERRQPHPLFDGQWYLARNADVRDAGVEPLAHYSATGWREGRQPHPLFNGQWYLGKNRDVRDAGLEPLAHYSSFGWLEGRQPHPLFNGEWYLDRNRDVREAGSDPLAHFVANGWREGRQPMALFDADWYYRNNPDVAKLGGNALIHYIEFGSAEGRSPHPLFDVKWYAEVNADVSLAGHEPLAHYIEFGWSEGRSPHPLFDTAWYLATNHEVARSIGEPLTHYIETGWKKGCEPHRIFSGKRYLVGNPDVLEAGREPLSHYVEFGWLEGRSPHPLFDVSWYLAGNPDVKISGREPLSHYVQRGWKEGRKPNPYFSPLWYSSVYSVGNGEPLAHYATVGEAQNHKPCPYFDPIWYQEHYKDVTVSALEHFVAQGALERRKPNAAFDSDWYSREYQLPSEVSPLQHFLEIGQAAGLRPNCAFDTCWYRREHIDALNSTGCAPFEHYLVYGIHSRAFRSELEKLSGRDLANRSESDFPSAGNLVPAVIENIVSVFFGREPYIVFLSVVDPFNCPSGEGYVQRLRSIDARFKDWKRLYVCLSGQGEGSNFRRHAEGVFALYLSDPLIGEVVVGLAKNAAAVYTHTIFPLRNADAFEAFTSAKRRIIDLHGVVPEELELQGDPIGATQAHELECQALLEATEIVCVTHSMKDWISAKYPVLEDTRLIVVPIVVDYPYLSTVNERSNLEDRLIYAGGVQEWQCLPLVVAHAASIDLAVTIVTQETDAVENILAKYSENQRKSISVKSAANTQQVWIEYLKADFGYALRTNSIVNRVSCPTKIVEYCAAGVIPILHYEEIGDFQRMGLSYILRDSFIEGQIPTQKQRMVMMENNIRIFQQIRLQHYEGVNLLLDRIVTSLH